MEYENIIALSSKVFNDKDFNFEFNILSDIRDASIELQTLQQIKTTKVPEEFKSIQKKRKSALFTNSPNQVVFTEMLKMDKSSEFNILIRAFSTLETALLWLGIDEKEEVVIKEVLIKLALG